MKKQILVGILALVAVAGCIKKKDVDFKNLQIDNWQPDWALPVLYSDMTLKNVVKTGTDVREDAEGLYSLHYSSSIASIIASDYITIPNQSYNTPNITLTAPISSPGFFGTVTDSFSSTFNYSDASGTQLAHVAIKGGMLNINFNTTFRQNIAATFIFPRITNSSGPLQLTLNVAYPATTATAAVDLSGYTIDLTNGTSSNNLVGYKVRYTITGTGQPISTGDNISAGVGMTDIKYHYFDGRLGSYSIPIPNDTINVGVFDNTLSANIFIRNPKVHLHFSNSFGVGVSAKLSTLYGMTNTGTTVPMVVPDFAVAGATTLGGAAAATKITLDSTNSTVQTMFNPAPNVVVYGGSVTIMPGGSGYSFITDTSRFALTADAELPAWFKIIDFALQDTVKLELPVDTSLLQSAEFKMLMDNAFPLYGRVQLYFADANYNLLDSLVPTADDIIGEAPVDADGKVTGRTQKVTTFKMTKTQYNNMAPNVRWAVIRGSLKTSGNSTIKILSSNSLKVKLAFRFKLNVSSTDL